MNRSCLSRRSFLKSTAALGTVSYGGGLLSGASLFSPEPAAKNARVDFCFSLYGMRSLKFDDALKTCAEIGYDGVELDCGRGQGGDPNKLSAAARRDMRKRLEDLELALPALMENLPLLGSGEHRRQNRDRLKAVAQLGHELSPDAVPVIETVLGGRPNQWENVKEQMAAALEEWAKTAEAARTIIAVKAHIGGALHTPQGAKWLLERVDSRWIRLNYDFGHFQLREFDLEESLKLLLDKTVFIHVKDNKGRLGDFRFLLPGEGDVDYVSYFRLLKAAGYRGAVCVEVSGQIHRQSGYDPHAAAKTSYANLAPLLAKAKLRG